MAFVVLISIFMPGVTVIVSFPIVSAFAARIVVIPFATVPASQEIFHPREASIGDCTHLSFSEFSLLLFAFRLLLLASGGGTPVDLSEDMKANNV